MGSSSLTTISHISMAKKDSMKAAEIIWDTMKSMSVSALHDKSTI
jgi:hypothetical protein